MVSLTLAQFFAAFAAVFLALIGASWFLHIRRRSRWETKARRIFICGICLADIRDEPSRLRLRCSKCGATFNRLHLSEKDASDQTPNIV